MNPRYLRSKKIALMGLMLAMVIVLLWIERMLPPLPILPPNFKLGLSNIIVMYILFFIGRKEAITLVVLKAFFNMMIRGPIGGLLSLSGGIASILIIILMMWIFKEKVSYTVLSIAGAIFHNIGQLIVISLLFQNFLLLTLYLPMLLVVGTISGTLTGIVLKVLLPAFERLHKEFDDSQKK